MTNALSHAAQRLKDAYHVLVRRLPLVTYQEKPAASPALLESFPLLDLPNELLTMVVDDAGLSVKDLANLRLTCELTKHFASSTLARCQFSCLHIQFTHDGFNCFKDLLNSDLGGHTRCACISVVHTARCGCDEPNSHIKREYKKIKTSKLRDEYPQLEELQILGHNGPVRSWTKIVRAAVHLRSFYLEDFTKASDVKHTAVYRHTFDRNDELLLSIKSDTLEEVKLSNLHISAKILKRLLKRHHDTIATIIIWNCVLVDGKWCEMLDWISLHLANLSSLTRHEGFKKKVHRYLQPTSGLAWAGPSPYAVTTLNAPLEMELVGRTKFIAGLSNLLAVHKQS